MMKTFAIWFLFATVGQLIVAATATVNYCDPALCKDGARHIGCDNKGLFHSRCIDPQLVEMTPELKEEFLYQHNSIRNFVISGDDPTLLPACRMTELEWDDELAYLAELHARKCDLSDDPCRNTHNFKHVGQVYQSIVTFERQIQDIPMIRYIANQKNDTVYDDEVDEFPPPPWRPTLVVGANMLNDLSTRIGCAAVKYTAFYQPGTNYTFVCDFAPPGEEAIYMMCYEDVQEAMYDENTAMTVFSMTCNFNSSPTVGQPIYKTCDVPASGCIYGPSCRNPKLCKPCEPIDPNNILRTETSSVLVN